jgi:hypothetical protein
MRPSTVYRSVDASNSPGLGHIDKPYSHSIVLGGLELMS